MAVRNLVFLRNLLSLIKAEGFWDCYFLVFGSFCVSPRSLGGGVHQDYLVTMNLFLFVADTSGVLCFKRCCNWPVRGLGGAKCSDTLRNC